ncbi:putative Toxin Rv0299 [Frankia sp. AiPs1]|uniref:type II toxin-antitoxin system PemK/MazF family toxin n=1 Tax=Frankia sp. AiPa1 TaxID=573492 RepID=UPI00202B0296|nr:type II toxin-antitoxin system PemK/MazF family toxin [Frankia sp. AiPa1]MCL9758703.1 type II toxin-antitoxin system PemK/MazF family toxin [Frankia sp. AiPa1]
MRQGEVWARADAPSYALIVSADLYNDANTGRVVVCPVIPGEPLPFDDYAADVGITDPVSGTVLPELVAWMPAAGLSHRLGALGADSWQRADHILRRVLGH